MFWFQSNYNTNSNQYYYFKTRCIAISPYAFSENGILQLCFTDDNIPSKAMSFGFGSAQHERKKIARMIGYSIVDVTNTRKASSSIGEVTTDLEKKSGVDPTKLSFFRFSDFRC